MMTRIIEPLGRQADRQRIIEKLARALSDEIKRKRQVE